MYRVPDKIDPTETQLSIVRLLLECGGDLQTADYDG